MTNSEIYNMCDPKEDMFPFMDRIKELELLCRTDRENLEFRDLEVLIQIGKIKL